MSEILIFAFGFFLGGLLLFFFHQYKYGTFQKIAADLLAAAELEGYKHKQSAEMEAKQKIYEKQQEFDLYCQSERKKIQTEETRLKQREDKLETRLHSLEEKLTKVEKQEFDYKRKCEQLEEDQKIVDENKARLQKTLENAAGLTASEAKESLLKQLNDELNNETANLIRKKIKEAEESAEQEVSRILSTAINRLAVPCVSEVTINTVSLPNDEMKGRIIGRDGRNIRALERATEVNFVIDDTPGAVVLSAFDPIRLHVAKQAVQELIKDGRIHPTRIEEVVEKAKVTINKKIVEYGQDAALRTGQTHLHPELIQLLGKLKFRYSYGQNVLDHSVEVSHLMGLIAGELHLDTKLAKRIGLLHDIGKAVTHEIEGTHAVIGHDMALKYGEPPEVANGIGCHHKEMDPITVEGSFCGACDAISASRPGARIEAVGEYVKRVKDLEKIAYEFPGIEKAYAMQAGKELCIVVLPEMIDDPGTLNLARDLSKKIEKKLTYPGQIKVTVIREKRAVSYAN